MNVSPLSPQPWSSKSKKLTRWRCGLPEGLRQDASCKLPVSVIKWCISNSGKLNASEFFLVCSTAWDLWAEHAPIKVDHLGKCGQENVNIGVEWIDGPGNVLGYAELPCGVLSRVKTRIDAGENWRYWPSDPGDGPNLLAVVAHEIGHCLGLGHGPEGSLMQPYYSPDIWEPQEWDIRELQRRYGKRDEPPKGGGMDWEAVVRFVVITIQCVSENLEQFQRNPLLGIVGTIQCVVTRLESEGIRVVIKRK